MRTWLSSRASWKSNTCGPFVAPRGARVRCTASYFETSEVALCRTQERAYTEGAGAQMEDALGVEHRKQKV